MGTVDYRNHARASALEALAFRAASRYEPALEGLTRAFITRDLIVERQNAGSGIGDLARASAKRLDQDSGGRDKWSYTKKHSLEVAQFNYVMACEALRQNVPDARGLDPKLAFVGGLIHDIGKTFLPIAIVVKELGVSILSFTFFRDAQLTDAEKRILREEHIAIGTKYVRFFGGGRHLRVVLDMTGLHHVLHNGSDSGVPSYPSLIMGKDLPFHARIAKTADFISAVLPRHYRCNGHIESLPGALAYAITVSGLEIDPLAVRCFMTGIYPVTGERADSLIQRLAHPEGMDGIRDIHKARLYAKDVVCADREFRGVVESRDLAKEAAYRSEISEVLRFYSLDLAAPYAN